MKVIYILPSLKTTGGTAAKIVRLIKYSKYGSIVFVPQNDSDKDYFQFYEHPNVELFIYDADKGFFKTLKVLIKIAKEKNAKIFHTFFPNGYYLATIASLFMKNTKVVRSMEGAVQRRLTIKICSILCLLKTDLVINISKYIQNYYSFFEKFKKKCIIYNSVNHIGDAYLFQNTQNEICELITLSGINEHKNIPLFPELSRILKNKGFKHHITICGDGPMRGFLETKIKEYGLENNITLTGNIAEPLPYLYNSNIYIHPANNEGFGLSVAEAMAIGMPIIVSDRGALPELIDDEVNGLVRGWQDYDAWADAVIRLHNDKTLREKLGGAAIEKYQQNFTPEIYAKNMDAAYDELLNQ